MSGTLNGQELFKKFDKTSSISELLKFSKEMKEEINLTLTTKMEETKGKMSENNPDQK